MEEGKVHHLASEPPDSKKIEVYNEICHFRQTRAQSNNCFEKKKGGAQLRATYREDWDAIFNNGSRIQKDIIVVQQRCAKFVIGDNAQFRKKHDKCTEKPGRDHEPKNRQKLMLQHNIQCMQKIIKESSFQDAPLKKN